MTPFGWPRGSVRALITLALVVLAGFSLYLTGAVAEWLATLIVVAVVLYFSVRRDEAPVEEVGEVYIPRSTDDG